MTDTNPPNLALLEKIAEFRRTGQVPAIRMGVDATIPDEDVFWAHRDTRGLGTDFVDIALKNTNYDLQTPDGLANVRAFHVAICQTIVKIGGFRVPPEKEVDPSSPAFIETITKDDAAGTETHTQIAEMSPIAPSPTLSPPDKLDYELARGTLLNTLYQYQKRFALLAGDRNWDAPPVRSKNYCPIFTQDSDPTTGKAFSLPTLPPKPSPNANPDEVPVLIGQEVATTVLVTGIVALAVVGCVLAYQASDLVKINKGVDTLKYIWDANHNDMTDTTREMMKILDDHTAEDRKNGKVTPLTPAEKEKLFILREQQKLYYEKSKAIETQIFGLTKPSPSATNTLMEQLGSALKTAAWLGAGILVGKIILDAVVNRRKDPEPHTPTSHAPEETPHGEPHHGGSTVG